MHRFMALFFILFLLLPYGCNRFEKQVVYEPVFLQDAASERETGGNAEPTDGEEAKEYPVLELPWNGNGWSIDQEYVLTIETQQGMEDFADLMMQGREFDGLGFCFEKADENLQTLIRRKIKSVKILDLVEYIPDYTFMNFEALEVCNVPAGIKMIGRNAFMDCAGLRQCILSDSICSIGSDAFSGCLALQEFHIPILLGELKYGMILDCDGLLELTIPKNVRIVRESAVGSDRMQRIIFEGTIEYVEGLYLGSYSDLPSLREIVFLQGPPVQNGEEDPYGHADGKLGISGESDCIIYYLNANEALWAPNGETEWNGFPIVGIDSIDELPPVA